MLDGSYKSENRNGNVSDAELDALLAKWAEAEIEPPAGFHEEMMNRLRKEAQSKKKNNVVTVFAKHKRWTSIAAAAVLMLFCVPVVQGQLGSDATEAVRDTEVQMQAAEDGKRSVTEAENNKQPPESQNNRIAAAVKKTDSDALAEQPNKNTIMSAVSVPEVAQDNDEADIAVAQLSPEDVNQPMIAAFSLEDEDYAEEDAAGNTRISDHQPAAYSYRNTGADEENVESLETLELKLKDLEAMLLEYQTLLAENPDDTNLQEIVAEQQKAIDELRQKIEDRKAQDISQQAE